MATYDVFISHSSEEKQTVVMPLARLLGEAGLRVWVDDCELTIGDSLRRAIDTGLSQARFGVVVLSCSFFEKEWPQRELDGLLAREDGKNKLILPIWHGLTPQEVAKYSPILGARVAVSTSKGLPVVARAIRLAIAREYRQEKVVPQDYSDAMQDLAMLPEFPEIPQLEQVRRWGGIKETLFPGQPGRCVLESGIRLDDAEAASSLLETAVTKLKEGAYPTRALDSFRVVFIELTRNAFEHGCQKGEDKVYIVVDIGPWNCSLTVVNPPGVVFNVDSIMRRQRIVLARNDMRLRGRGLLLIEDLSDDLRSVQSGNAVKAVVERIPVSLVVSVEDGIAIIFVESGVHNDSLERRLTQVVYEHLHHDIVLDLSSAESGIGTTPITVIIRLAALCRKNGRRLVAIVPYNCGAFVPGALRAGSRSAAISRLREIRGQTTPKP
jgi:anti-sigma regulatory factor (Ser/Thr protein kinase)